MPSRLLPIRNTEGLRLLTSGPETDGIYVGTLLLFGFPSDRFHFVFADTQIQQRLIHLSHRRFREFRPPSGSGGVVPESEVAAAAPRAVRGPRHDFNKRENRRRRIDAPQKTVFETQ